jgi:flagellar protein FliS
MEEINKDEKGSKMYGDLAHNIYAQNNMGIESPAKLVEMLYEGVLRFNAQAKKAIQNSDVEKRVYWINRSTAIVTELISVLDESQGAVYEYLQGLYNYEITLLTSANIDANVEKLDEVSKVFKGLLEAWRESTNVA